MEEAPTRPAYGTTRQSNVSYLEVERAAIALLKDGKRPSVERIREKIGRGSPQTLLSALKRFWRDLGTRIESDPAALTRLPAEIVDAVETLWQRALALAADAARQTQGANLERLEFLKRENELKAHTISLREKELDAQLRAREQSIEGLEGHLRTAMTFASQSRTQIDALEARVLAAEADAETHRQRLGRFIAEAVVKNRKLVERKGRAKPNSRSRQPIQRRPKPKKARPPNSKRGSRG